MDLEGKRAIVTGGGGGIGRAAAVELARGGASVLLVDVDGDSLDESAQAAAEAGTDVRTVLADVSRSAEVEGYVATALSAFGTIDVFFNNAGITGAVSPVWEYPVDEFERVIAVNLRGVFLGLRHVLPVMVERRYGSVINTASLAGERGLLGTCGYNASKHGVVGLTRTAAAEAGPYGVRINAISPGIVDTPMFRYLTTVFAPDDPSVAMAGAVAAAPMARIAEPEEIATVVRFLASDAASFVNGVVLPIDGGVLAGISALGPSSAPQ